MGIRLFSGLSVMLIALLTLLFLDAFGDDHQVTAWIIGISVSVSFFFGIIANELDNKKQK